jgi:hypothetical protein
MALSGRYIEVLTRKLQDQHRHISELERCFGEISSVERSWIELRVFEFEPYRTYTVPEFGKLYRDAITKFQEEAGLKSMRIKGLIGRLCFMLALEAGSPEHAHFVRVMHRSLHQALIRIVSAQLEHIRDVLLVEPQDCSANQTRESRDIPAIEVRLSLSQSVISHRRTHLSTTKRPSLKHQTCVRAYGDTTV